MIREYETVDDDFGDFDSNLSLTDPLKDYLKLYEEKVIVDMLVSNEMSEEIWDQVSAGAREAVWSLLFNSQQPTEDTLNKAAALLKEHKSHAAFQSPFKYNPWIYLVRDELLKRKMLDFWRNVIVANELGPAWARDSDLFDEMDDPKPAAFYNFAGCMAPWLEQEICEKLSTV